MWLTKFDNRNKSVPHIGWNSAKCVDQDQYKYKSLYGLRRESKYYYVHSYAVPYQEGVLERHGWRVATAKYGDEEFVGAIGRENLFATQFHPEKSGRWGLQVYRNFLQWSSI